MSCIQPPPPFSAYCTLASCLFLLFQLNSQLGAVRTETLWRNRLHPSLSKRQLVKKIQWPLQLLPKAARAGTHTYTQLDMFWELILLCPGPYICQRRQEAPQNVLSLPLSLSQYVQRSANPLLLPALWTVHRQKTNTTSIINCQISTEVALKTQNRGSIHSISAQCSSIPNIDYPISKFPLAEEWILICFSGIHHS